MLTARYRFFLGLPLVKKKCLSFLLNSVCYLTLFITLLGFNKEQILRNVNSDVPPAEERTWLRKALFCGGNYKK